MLSTTQTTAPIPQNITKTQESPSSTGLLIEQAGLIKMPLCSGSMALLSARAGKTACRERYKYYLVVSKYMVCISTVVMCIPLGALYSV
jgi:hypothetical protein